MRYRVTIRGDHVELRGYVDGLAELSNLSDDVKFYGVVVASPADDDYDPFRAALDEVWREGYITGCADGESGNHVYAPSPNPYREE